MPHVEAGVRGTPSDLESDGGEAAVQRTHLLVTHLTAQIDALGQQQETYHRDCTTHQARRHITRRSARRATPLWLDHHATPLQARNAEPPPLVRPCHTLCRRATPSCAPSCSGCRRTTPCWRTAWRASERRRATRSGRGPHFTPLSWPHTLGMATHPQHCIPSTGPRLGAGQGAPRDGARARDGARLQPRLRQPVALLLLPAQPRAELHLRYTCDDLAAAAHPALLTRPPPRVLIGRALRRAARSGARDLGVFPLGRRVRLRLGGLAARQRRWHEQPSNDARAVAPQRGKAQADGRIAPARAAVASNGAVFKWRLPDKRRTGTSHAYRKVHSNTTYYSGVG